jgi:hypothetical protein
MINDYLADIQSYLLTDYPNTFVDGWFVDANEVNGGDTQEIMIERTGGSVDRHNPSNKQYFNIFVRDEFGDSLAVSRAIYRALHNKKGKLVNEPTAVSFQQIYANSPPKYWGEASNNRTVYLTQFTAHFVDSDLNNF